jgi:hypothetical protein
MTRSQVATQLGRPYTTIASWFKGRLISEAQFKDLKIRSDDAKRKRPSKRKPNKPKQPKRYYHPVSGEIFTEEDLADDHADITNGDTLYEIKAIHTYKETTTWELENLDEKD